MADQKKKVVVLDKVKTTLKASFDRVKNGLVFASNFANAAERHAALATKVRRDLDAAQFKIGDIIFFNPASINEVAINGNTDTTASVSINPAISGGRLCVKQLYASTLGRAIMNYDRDGNQVLDQNGMVKQIDGKGNELWDACHDCGNDDAVFNQLTKDDDSGKILVCVDVKTTMGPRFRDGVIIGNRPARLPLFEVYDNFEDLPDNLKTQIQTSAPDILKDAA